MEYRITFKQITFGNPIPNTVLERIHQVLGNIVRNFNTYQTYIDKYNPWLEILDAAEFVIFSITNRKKVYSTGQLIFGRYLILLIRHTVDWKLIRQKKHTQINKDNINQNIPIVDHDYKVVDNVIFTKHNTYKYEIPYTGPFLKTQCFTNGMVKLQNGVKKITYNIRHIHLYKFDTSVENSSSKNMRDNVNIRITSCMILYLIKYWKEIYDRMHMGTLRLIHILREREVFMMMPVLHNRLNLFRISDALGKGS